MSLERFQCCDCLDLFLSQDLTRRPCCQRRICLICLQNSAKCLDCARVPTKEVNLAQLRQEIIRIQEIAQEQTDFYTKWSYQGDEDYEEVQTAAQADAKAIQIHLELLEDLATRLVSVVSTGTEPNQIPIATVHIPLSNFIRSKDLHCGELVDSEGFLRSQGWHHRKFLESHQIYHSWEGYIPYNSDHLRVLSLYGLKTDPEFDPMGLVDPLKPLSQYLNLTRLDLAGAKIWDISALTELKLTALDLASTPVSDLSALAGMTTLTWLNLRSTKVVDITPLAKLVNLTDLDITNTLVVDLSCLSDKVKLYYFGKLILG